MEKKDVIGGNSGTVQYTFRIPVTLKAALELIAEKEDRSLSRQIISALKRYCDDHTKAL